MGLPAIILTALGLALAAPGTSADVSGRWKAEIDTPFALIPYTFVLKVAGSSLAGTAETPQGSTPLVEGRVAGDRVSFVELATFGERPLRIEYEGEHEGDQIRFTRRLGEWGTDTFVAWREGTEPPKPGPFPFQNPDVPIEARIDDILSRMSVDEKIACLGTRPYVPRLGIRGTGHVEGLHGLAMGGPGGWGRPSPVPTTTFPQAIGLAQTWDPELVRKAAAAEGFETRYMYQSPKYRRGGLVVRAPNADLGRDPRWGRTEECYGEDPFLDGTLVTAFVRGLQGDDPKYWQTASLLKHFLANSNENGRTRSSSDFDERLLREYYSVPFRMGIVEGGARAFMAAYNAINGVPATVNPILRSMAMDEWGLDGIICTDAGGLRFLVSEHKYYETPEQAAAGAIKAGINQFLDRYREPVKGALDEGLLKEADLDRALRGVFRVMIRLGLLDPPERVPYSRIGGGAEPWLGEEHEALAREVTRESIVLLKNEGLLLPLDPATVKSVAVLGPRADAVLLDWYSGTPPYTVTPLDALRSRLGAKAVTYVAGDQGEAAARAARAADVALVFVGNHPTCNAGWEQCPEPGEGKEAVDRKDVALAPAQVELVRRVLEANRRTIVILKSSFPYAIAWIAEHAPAIVQIAHGSQEEGNALADVLFGDYNPAGRLTETWPRSLDQLPPMMDYDIRHGRTYMYFQGRPLFPFGHGLSYSRFSYAGLRTSAETLAADGEVTVSLDLTNEGSRAGDEVVQMYVAWPASRVPRPAKQLAAFRRVSLAAGETKTVAMSLPASRLAYWNADRHAFVVEPGPLRVMIGSSSEDIRLERAVEVGPGPR
jgi:beta-glucosidase